MKKKILMTLALVAAMCFSVSAIDVYNHDFSKTVQAGTWGAHGAAAGVTGGWWYVGSCSLSTNMNAGLPNGTFRGCPVTYYGQAAGVGWNAAGINCDLRQDIPGPTQGDPTPAAGHYSTTEFTSGTTYTVTYSYLKTPNVACNYQFFVVNKDSGMGVLNYRPVDITVPTEFSWWFNSTNVDFVSISRTNRLVFRLSDAVNTSIVFDNITVQEASEKNWGFEFGSFHGWNDLGDCWNGGPLNYDGGVSIGGWDGTYYANSRACLGQPGGPETLTGQLQSKDFTIPENGYVQFKLGGYSYNPTQTNEPIYNYVTLNDAESGVQIGDKIYCPQTTGSMVITNIIPPIAYMGSGSNVYVKVVDDCALGAYGWLSFDSLETKVIPEPATIGLLAILGLAFLRRK